MCCTTRLQHIYILFYLFLRLAQANGEEIRYVTLCYAGLNVKLATYIDSDLDAVKEESNRELHVHVHVCMHWSGNIQCL